MSIKQFGSGIAPIPHCPYPDTKLSFLSINQGNLISVYWNLPEIETKKERERERDLLAAFVYILYLCENRLLQAAYSLSHWLLCVQCSARMEYPAWAYQSCLSD